MLAIPGLGRIARVLAVFSVAISVTSLLGYILDYPPFYQWNSNGVGMAINTGFCLILLAIAVILLSFRKGQ